MDWQPIETAPRNGQRILLGAYWGSTVGRFSNERWDFPELDDPWFDQEVDRITHWMPLPPGPMEKADA